MEGKEQMNYRIQLFDDAISCKKEPDRVPLYDNMYNWKVYYAKERLSKALNEPKAMTEVVVKYIKDFLPDVLGYPGTRNPMFFTNIFSEEQYYIIDDENYRMNYVDVPLMEESDYELLIKDTKKYFWETFMRKKWRL